MDKFFLTLMKKSMKKRIYPIRSIALFSFSTTLAGWLAIKTVANFNQKITIKTTVIP
jgi:hypothetical protein